MSTYRPHEFAKLVRRTVRTLQRWDREGILKAHRTPTNRRYYTHEQYLEFIGQKATAQQLRVVYCRISGSNQRGDLANQKQALEQFCIAAGKSVDLWLEDVGSGLNYKRKNFIHLLEMVERGEVSEIVIVHKDRLVRFGYDWFETFCQKHGAEIVVMNVESLSPEAELTQDLLSIIHGFSSRLPGLRKYRKQIAQYLEANENHQASQPATE